MFNVSPDLIILALIAGVILFRLFAVLGRKDDDGGNIANIKNNSALNNIIDISAKAEEVVNIAELEKDIAPEFEEVLMNVRKIDAHFSLKKFLDGAKKAFEMVLIAFAENDRATLKNLLDENIYKQFISEIDKRIKNNVTLNLTLVALPLVEIKNIQLVKNKLSIDVFYGSQQITLLKNDKGEIIEGNSSQIDHVEDMWGFSKTINYTDWKLVKVNAS
jgi:predicted lipid-binding transport protein (Tim44 family)